MLAKKMTKVNSVTWVLSERQAGSLKFIPDSHAQIYSQIDSCLRTFYQGYSCFSSILSGLGTSTAKITVNTAPGPCPVSSTPPI
jgi:hypothetical protein